MQTAPATSRKTLKVANDDFLSAYKIPFGPDRRQQEDWQHGHRPEHKPERALPGAAGHQASSHQMTRTAHRNLIMTTGRRNVGSGL
jgi:hypothetical protein